MRAQAPPEEGEIRLEPRAEWPLIIQYRQAVFRAERPPQAPTLRPEGCSQCAMAEWPLSLTRLPPIRLGTGTHLMDACFSPL